MGIRKVQIKVADALMVKGLYNEAVKEYEQILSVSPDDFITRINYIKSLLLSADEGHAYNKDIKKIISQAIRKCPDDVSFACNLMDMLGEHLSTDDIIDIFETVDIEDINWYFKYAISNYYLKKRNKDKAIKMRVEALGLDVSNVPDNSLVSVVKSSFDDVLKQDLQYSNVKRVSLLKNFCCEKCRQPLRLIEVEKPIVLAGEWWIIAATGELYTDMHNGVPGQKNPYYFHVENSDKQCNAIVPEPIFKHKRKAVLIGGSTNYYHWTIDFLPLLFSVLTDEEIKTVPIVINADLAPFQKEILKYKRLTRTNLIKVQYPSAHQFNSCLVPIMDFESRIKCLNVGSRDILKKHKKIDVIDADKIYLKRGETEHRQAIGEEKLIKKLEERGFVSIDAGQYSVFEQMAIFAKAKTVVGVHGAAMTNIVYAGNSCRVVEISSSCWDMPFFEDIAKVCGQNYTKIKTDYKEKPSQLPLNWDCVITDECIDSVLNTIY
jgi:capsular polysaccharide biosynthesis protein